MKPARIDVYYWEGCPSHPEALELLRDVLAEQGVEAPVELHEVLTHEEAEELALPGLADDPRSTAATSIPQARRRLLRSRAGSIVFPTAACRRSRAASNWRKH